MGNGLQEVKGRSECVLCGVVFLLSLVLGIGGMFVVPGAEKKVNSRDTVTDRGRGG